METIAPRIGGEKIYLLLVMGLGMALAGVLGMLIGTDAVATVIVIAAAGGALAWLVVARKRWWLLMPAAGTLGGYFYFGFKIYPHEIALLGCIVPLLISRALSGRGFLDKQRSPFPFAMYLLSFYLFAHWVGSNVYNRLNGEGGYGNVTRAYVNALWVILFLFAFRRYGSSKFLPAALLLTYLAAFLRVLTTVVIYLSKTFAYIPVINYVLPGSTHSGVSDLRGSGLALGTLAICYCLFKKGFVSRLFHGAVFLASFVAVLFGAGRTALVLICLAPILAAVLYRRIIPILFSVVAAGGLLFTLNAFPTVLNGLPFLAQRSASILLLDKGEAAKYGLATGSDEWHATLREIGFKKWTKDWNSFVFGTGIRPYDQAIAEFRMGATTNEDFLASSAKVGAYESGWWTVIAVTGLVGIVSYVSVLLYLLRRLLPVLLRDKVRDHRRAFAFMAVFNIVIWLGLGWTNGGFPSTEIMFGFLALFALDDEKAERPSAITPIPVAHLPAPRQTRTLQRAR